MNPSSRGLVEPTPSTLGLYLLFALLTSIASIYVWAGHTNHIFWFAGVLFAVFIGLVAVVTFLACPSWLRALLGSWAFWLVCILAITAADTIRYQRHVLGHTSSTAAQALVQPAIRLAHGHDPYQLLLQGGAPISPGPGWIILLAPLTLFGGVAALLGIVVGFCTWLVRQQSPAGAGLILLFVLMQPVLLGESIVAHDIFVIPIFFAILCLLTERWVDDAKKLSALAVVSAAFATSRLPMIALLMILCIGLFRLRPRAGALFAVISLPLTLALHVAFFLWARKDRVFYQPLHLFRRGAHATNLPLQSIGICIVLLVGASLLLRMGAQARQWIAYGGLFLAAAFVPVGLGELRNIHGNYIIWEGANYVSFGGSLLAIAVALHARPSSLETAETE